MEEAYSEAGHYYPASEYIGLYAVLQYDKRSLTRNFISIL